MDSDGDGRLTIDDARSFLLISSPPEIQNNRKSDIIQFDNKSIEKMQAAANKVLKSMVSLSHNKQTQNINSNTVNSPTKDGLTSYDYYPYDSIRKFNSPSKNYASPVKNQANESKKNFLYESQTFENENKIAENEKADFLSKMNEKPISNEKISYRNTINPSAELVPFELTAKKNKSIANSSDIENIKDNSIIKAIIHDVEEKNTFMKEIENLCEKNTIEVKIPRDEKNPEILKKMLEYNIKIIKSSAKLEEIKCDLIKKGDFNLIDFFGCLDKNKKGYSTFQEFEHFLKEENMDLDRELIDLFFKKFDQKNLQKLRFIDFERLLTTHDYNENDRKPINIRGFHFKYKEV